jgi:hypothetical protein
MLLVPLLMGPTLQRQEETPSPRSEEKALPDALNQSIDSASGSPMKGQHEVEKRFLNQSHRWSLHRTLMTFLRGCSRSNCSFFGRIFPGNT